MYYRCLTLALNLSVFITVWSVPEIDTNIEKDRKLLTQIHTLARVFYIDIERHIDAHTQTRTYISLVSKRDTLMLT